MAEPLRSTNGGIASDSVLTTEEILRALAGERDYTDGRIGILEERLRAIDKATELLNETVNRVPTDLQQGLGNLESLANEKFSSIQTQFQERDTRSERESRDNKVAVDAAFAAQKEAAAKQDESNLKAIAKSEVATNEAINKMGDLFKATTDAQGDKLDDLKTRVTTVEQRKVGSDEHTSVAVDRGIALRANVAIGISACVGFLGVASLIASLIIK